MTEQSWTIETLAAKARELLATAVQLKSKYEWVRSGGGGRSLATVGRERQVLNKQLLAMADAYRELRKAPEVAERLAANPAPAEGSDLDVLEKLAAERPPKAEQDPQGAAGAPGSKPWKERWRR